MKYNHYATSVCLLFAESIEMTNFLLFTLFIGNLVKKILQKLLGMMDKLPTRLN